MNIEQNYKESINKWVYSQQKRIKILELQAKYLDNEIKLKNDLLQNTLETIEHEKKFLEDYIKTIKK